VLNAFIERSLHTGRLTLQDAGAAMRTYCYVSDAVEILWNILLHGHQAIYNVGGTSRTSVADLARSIGNQLSVPVSFPLSEQAVGGAPNDVHLDMGRVMQDFGKHNYIPLETGLQRTIQWQTALYRGQQHHHQESTP
jgi:nucleoside-diphosphate-sugar epimerase